jgi:hypothetical protein
MEHHMDEWLEENKRAAASHEKKQERDKKGGDGGDDAEAATPLVVWKASKIPVPSYHAVLIQKVLAGDTDAIGLLGTSVEELVVGNVSFECRREVLLDHATESTMISNVSGGLGGCATPLCSLGSNCYEGSERDNFSTVVSGTLSPPTAVRAEYYRYQFSNWDNDSGEWWSREQMTLPHIFEPSHTKGAVCVSTGIADAEADPETKCTLTIRRSPWHRHWILFLLLIGIVWEVHRIELATGTKPKGASALDQVRTSGRGWTARNELALSAVFVAGYSSYAAAVLVAEYPDVAARGGFFDPGSVYGVVHDNGTLVFLAGCFLCSLYIAAFAVFHCFKLPNFGAFDDAMTETLAPVGRLLKVRWLFPFLLVVALVVLSGQAEWANKLLSRPQLWT